MVDAGLYSYVRDKFPETVSIKDEGLRDIVIRMWVMAMDEGGWSDLEGIPFTLLIPDVPYDLVTHTRRVTAEAVAVAGARGDLDMDLVIAGGLTHDVGKLLEFVKLPDGSVVKSETGKLLRHPVTGMELAKRAGAPVKLQHIIIVHSKEGEAVRRIPEAILIHHCDFIDFHIAKYHAGM
ncbi:MAG: HDIG domain-containing metalloprotein [Thermoplasmatota archaeon]